MLSRRRRHDAQEGRGNEDDDSFRRPATLPSVKRANVYQAGQRRRRGRWSLRTDEEFSSECRELRLRAGHTPPGVNYCSRRRRRRRRRCPTHVRDFYCRRPLEIPRQSARRESDNRVVIVACQAIRVRNKEFYAGDILGSRGNAG